MILIKLGSVEFDIVACKVLVLNIPYPAFILDNIVMLFVFSLICICLNKFEFSYLLRFFTSIVIIIIIIIMINIIIIIKQHIRIYVTPIAGQTAGPIGLKFFVDTYGWLYVLG